MKRLIAVELTGALAACGNPAEESDEPAATATPAATETAAEESSAGTWDVTLADGSRFTATLNADGTYQDSDAAGAVTARGTWEDRPDGTTCFDSEGDDPVVCYTVGEPAADGSMIATPNDDSGPLTIRRIS